MNISTRGSLNGESEELTFKVGGMDCGSCAAKIETALSRLPGVADVKVSVARERLNLSLAENKTPVEKIEDTLRKLAWLQARFAAARQGSRGKGGRSSRPFHLRRSSP